MNAHFDEARALLDGAVASGATPAASVEVGRRGGPLWRAAFGRLSRDPGAPACRIDTIFDLASLTKVVVTTSVALRAVSDDQLNLDAPLSHYAPEWSGDDRASVTLRHLLDHSSGLPAHGRLWQTHHGQAAYEAAICTTPLAYPPGSTSVYSDLGFILAGFVLERQTGRTLDAWLPELLRLPEGEVLTFRPAESLRSRIAPTEFDPGRNRLLRGDVHDENAAALDGVAAHAGTFGTVTAVGRFARLVLETLERASALGEPAVMRRFMARTGVPGSSRAIGWDTMLPTSSCGTRMSPSAIGHTGFTGTSLWIDWERGLYVVLLSNRVHPTRTNARFTALRPRIHDAILRAV